MLVFIISQVATPANITYLRKGEIIKTTPFEIVFIIRVIMGSKAYNRIPFESSTSREKLFSIDSNTLMDNIRNAVKNRDKIEEPEYVVSMDLNEGIPYKIYKSNKKEYFDEFYNN